MKIPPKQRLSLILVILLAIVLILAFVFSPKKNTETTPTSMNESPMPMLEMKETVVTLSPRAQKLAQIEVAPVIRAFIPSEIRLYGKVDYDETKLEHITAWVPARIEKLYVNFTGMEVKSGDPMADYYSPELIVAQEELLQSLNAYQTLENTNTSFAKDQSKRNMESARTKLRLLGIHQRQIEAIEKNNQVSEFLTIYAPTSGIVIHKNALEGEYVKEGTEIFTIADLDEVWIQLEAYESDLVGLKLDQKITFTTDAHPGETFTGVITFIDPFLNEKTRTANVRVVASNQKGKLKPGMYVTGIVDVYVSIDGKISSQKPTDTQPPLVIPATAPLITGKRTIVYIQDPNNASEYRLREIVLGPRVKDYYIVASGIQEGELVVVHGNFKIDSAAQIQAKPSMMSPEGASKPMKGHGH